MSFAGRRHKPESNAKRSKTITALHAAGTTSMGWKKHRTDEDRRRARLTAQLKHRYGITLDDVERMREQQESRCAICNEEKKLVVDHDHNTGTVRALLCTVCNFAVGCAERVGPEAIVTYLKEHAA